MNKKKSVYADYAYLALIQAENLIKRSLQDIRNKRIRHHLTTAGLSIADARSDLKSEFKTINES